MLKVGFEKEGVNIREKKMVKHFATHMCPLQILLPRTRGGSILRTVPVTMENEDTANVALLDHQGEGIAPKNFPQQFSDSEACASKDAPLIRIH